MICLDTNFLVDLWRNRGVPDHPAAALLRRLAGETVAVPVHAAGEFLEGAAIVSEDRLADAVRFLRLFEMGIVGLETAQQYARIVAHLRRHSLLAGLSKPDVWIAAWAREHAAGLATRNTRHFQRIPELRLIAY